MPKFHISTGQLRRKIDKLKPKPVPRKRYNQAKIAENRQEKSKKIHLSTWYMLNLFFQNITIQ